MPDLEWRSTAQEPLNATEIWALVRLPKSHQSPPASSWALPALDENRYPLWMMRWDRIDDTVQLHFSQHVLFRCTWRPHHTPNRFTAPGRTWPASSHGRSWTTEHRGHLPPSESSPYLENCLIRSDGPAPDDLGTGVHRITRIKFVGEVPGRPCVRISPAGQSDQDRKMSPVQTWTPCSTKTPVNRARSPPRHSRVRPRRYSPDRISVSCFARFLAEPNLSRVGQVICAALMFAHLRSCFPFVMLPRLLCRGEARSQKMLHSPKSIMNMRSR